MQDLEVGMDSEKDRSSFEAVGGRAAEIGEREGTERGPAGTEKEIICGREVLTLSTPVFVPNVQRLAEGQLTRAQGLKSGLLQD